jgi:hypothetical protein
MISGDHDRSSDPRVQGRSNDGAAGLYCSTVTRIRKDGRNRRFRLVPFLEANFIRGSSASGNPYGGPT